MKNSFRKFLSVFAVSALSLLTVALSGCATRNSSKDTSSDTHKPIHSVIYSIEYVGIQDGKETEITPLLWQNGGLYPSAYCNCRDTLIDDLRGKMTRVDFGDLQGAYIGSGVIDPDNPRKDYSFYGWFLDKECTQPFDGIIESTSVGNITLYAKIEVGYWTNNH